MASGRIKPEQAEQVFADAARAYEAGALDEAALLCRQLQTSFPRNAAVLQLFALVELRRGNHDEARAKFARALEISPEDPELLANYGSFLAEAGRHGQAGEMLRRALSLSPGNPQVATNLVLALHAGGDAQGAADELRSACARFPRHAPLQQARRDIARARADMSEIAAASGMLAALAPADAGAQAAFGEALLRLNRDDEARAAFERWVELAPADPAAHDSLGVALQKLGRFEAAIGAHFRALERRPSDGRIMMNIGAALDRAGKSAEAEAILRRAAQLPETAEGAAINLAALRLRHHADIEGALAIYRDCQARVPGHAAARLAAGMLHLLRGDAAAGFELMEARFDYAVAGARAVPMPAFSRPRWQGESLAGKTLLVWRDLDIAADIFNLHALRPVVERAGAVIVDTHPRLVRLLRRSVPAGVEVTSADPVTLVERYGTRIDVHAPAGDLPRHVHRALPAMESRLGWLVADAARVATLRARYAAHGTQPLVGLAWRAPPGEGPVGAPPMLADWRALLDSPDGVFVGLESAAAAAELDVARGRSSATLVADAELDPEGDLDDLAARLAALDLVIGPDTPTVRLAAALGVETWVLLPPVPGWIWFEDRDDSPWSPALRLFRAAPGEGWGPAIRAVALALARRRGEG
jgi:Flp pilus assembly protein TadD